MKQKKVKSVFMNHVQCSNWSLFKRGCSISQIELKLVSQSSRVNQDINIFQSVPLEFYGNKD